MAFYLKYRPQTLDQLVGQEAIKKLLFSSFLANKLSHAYLFVGPRGTGKTSTARILAKMVNCELVQSSELVVGSKNNNSTNYKLQTNNIPCNKCQTCMSITDGSNLDLIEIDAASNRGIDDIRALREKIKLAPTQASKKVYIIDEVHMLTTEAFNALLKTLEEPPSHTLFILATTDVQKVPQTILSRVQRLDFKPATTEQLIEALSKVVKEEKLEINKEALEFLAKKAEGSFRDGIKFLDQVSSVEGKKTVEVLAEIFKSGQTEDLFLLLDNLSKKDMKAALISLDKIFAKGIDAKIFTSSLMDVLRNIVFIKNGLGESLVKPQYAEENYSKLESLSKDFNNADLIKILDLLQTSLEKLKFTSIQSLPLELVMVEVCQLSGLSSQLSGESQSVASESVSETNKQTTEKPETENREQKTDNNQFNISTSSDILKLKEKWNFVLETIRPYNFSLEALLRSINISECTDTTVVIEVPYSFHQRILEAPKNREILESILSDILARQIKVATILGTHPAREEDIANIEVAADDEIIRAAAEIFNSDTVN
ncbi:DNA polymerase III subunit gamma/tau [Candidatus Daviesbacteria bacterium]|nr:DNA polymerase III subunit gamma/tau [Candidatus Daviesbacteria bacterium]